MRAVIIVVALVVGLQGAAPAGSLQIRLVEAQQPPTIHLLLRVFDATGNSVAGLNTGDFTAFEDGLPVSGLQVRQAHPDENPVAVSFLIDTSGSMTPDGLAAATAGVKTVLQHLAAGDRSEVATVNNDIVFLSKLDEPPDPSRLDNLDPGDRTARAHTKLNDALSGALDRLQAQPTSTKAIVVLTDGDDDGSLTPHDAVIQKAAATHIPIYAIGLGNVDATPLQDFANASGGLYSQAPAPSDLANLYTQVASQLRTEYHLTYTTTQTTGTHQITVVANTSSGQISSTASAAFGSPAPTPKKAGSTPVLAIAAILVALLAGGLGIVLLSRRSSRDKPSGVSGPSVRALVATDQFRLVDQFNVAFPLMGAGIVVGRDPRAHIVIDDPSVSRTHARLDVDGNGVWVQDLGSSNGTAVNGAPIERHLAHAGDSLQFGDQELQLQGPS